MQSNGDFESGNSMQKYWPLIPRAEQVASIGCIVLLLFTLIANWVTGAESWIPYLLCSIFPFAASCPFIRARKRYLAKATRDGGGQGVELMEAERRTVDE